MSFPLTLCGNCESLYIDTNPQTGQRRYDIPGDYPSLITMDEVDDSELSEEDKKQFKPQQGFFRACPHCKTDAYLCDYNGEITVAEGFAIGLDEPLYKIIPVYEND